MTIYVDWDVPSQSKQTEQNCMTELPTCRSANACLPACLKYSLTNLPAHPSNQPLTLAGWLLHASVKQALTRKPTHHPLMHPHRTEPGHPTTHSPIHSLTHCIYHSLTYSSTHSLTHSLTHSHHSLTSQVNSNFILDSKPGYENKVTLERELM